MAQSTVILSARVPPGLRETLRALALANRRSFGTQVNIVLEEGLKALGEALPKGTRPRYTMAELLAQSDPPDKKRGCKRGR